MTSETSSTEETTTSPSQFRSATDVQDIVSDTPTLQETNPNQPIQSTEKADGVFIGYDIDNGVPFVVDYLGIRDTFKADPTVYSEIADITDYLENLVRSGEIDNSTKAVNEKLKQLEQLSGIDPTERVSMKLTRLAEYAKFENKINEAKRSSLKWSR